MNSKMSIAQGLCLHIPIITIKGDKTMKKNYLAVLFALVILTATILPATAAEMSAAEPKKFSPATAVRGICDGMKYEIKDGEVTITGYTADLPSELVIPETIEGYAVTTIGYEAFFWCNTLSSVQMPYITRIEGRAFYECSVNTVEMPSVQEVAGDSFFYTPWRANLTDEFCIFGDGVLVDYNGTDTEVTLPDSVKYVAGFYGNDDVVSVNTNKATVLGYKSFCGCNYLTKIVMPQVTTIENMAFSYCDAIVTVEMPQVTAVGFGSFYECKALIHVDMPQVTSIGSEAFAHCNHLTTLTMPVVKEVWGAAFIATQWLANLTDEFCIFGDGVLVDYNGTDTDVKLPDSVKYVSGFYGNDDVVSVNTNKATCVGNEAFSRCDALTHVEMPQVTSIGNVAFYQCKALNHVDMPQATSIGYDVFSSCAALTEITMPQVQSIGDYAFLCCEALSAVTMPQVKSIGDCAFSVCSAMTTVSIPTCTEYIGVGAFSGCSKLADISVSSDNPYYLADDGILYNKDKTELLAYPAAEGDITIADSVKSIGAQAFSACRTITHIKVPQVTSIGEAAFSNCDELNSVEMMKVTSIGEQAFFGCIILSSAYFYSDAPTEFGVDVFDCCADDFTIYFAKGTSGWTTPEWRGYSTQEFTPGERPNGDLTGEGVVNTADAVSLLKLAAGMIELTPEQEAVADVNRDGTINTADAVTILKYAAGLIDEL